MRTYFIPNRNFWIALTAFLILFSFTFTVMAQEATQDPALEATPIATEVVVVPPIEPTALPTVVIEPTPAAPEPPVVVVQQPDQTPTFWIFAAVIFGLTAMITLVLRPLILQLGASAPAWAVEAGFSGVGRALESAKDYAELTPSLADDDLVQELIDVMKALHEEMLTQRRERASPVPSRN